MNGGEQRRYITDAELAEALADLLERIVALEARIAALEKKPKP